MKKISSLKGKKISDIFVTYGSREYLIIRLGRGAEIQVAADDIFDKDGMHYENDAPDLPKPKARAK